jgi:TolA-binding protein
MAKKKTESTPVEDAVYVLEKDKKNPEPVEKKTDPSQNLVTQTEDFFENPKNRNVVFIGLGAVALLIAGFFGFNYYKSTQNVEAQNLMSPAVFQYEADSLKKALNGSGANEGLQTIAEDYSLTDAGNLADFYVGAAHLKEGRFDEAIEFLKKFKSNDLLVQARAYSLIGDAYLEKDELSDAIRYYKLASEYKANKFTTPPYLMKLALAQEKNKDLDAAMGTYEKIISEYSDSMEGQQAAKKHKARLEGLTGK